MAGSLDTAFKNAAKTLVADLGSELDTTVTYVRKTAPAYNTSTGALTTTDTTYSNISVPVEVIRASEQDENEERKAKIYITPDLIGNSQPTIQDEITLKYAGANQTGRVIDVITYRGGQEYLYIVMVTF